MDTRLLVPRLQATGYGVRYREFPGGHIVPPEKASEALAWALRPAEAPISDHWGVKP